jgi:DNA-binding PadR family transcriptional regulator
MMKLTNIEGDFLSRLSLESWTSPPVFDHSLLERMEREKYVTTQATGHGVCYEITDLGRTAVLKQAMPS